MGIPSIGIVAVLVANVTFIAWATPPGESISLPASAWLQCHGLFARYLHANWALLFGYTLLLQLLTL